MTAIALPYNQLGLHFGNGVINFTAGGLSVLLTTAAYTPNVDTHAFLTDVTNEVVGTGYTAGGAPLTGVGWAFDPATHRTVLTADPTVWPVATFTARYAVLHMSYGAPEICPLIGFVDFGADESPVGMDFTLTWANLAAGGIFRTLPE